MRELVSRLLRDEASDLITADSEEAGLRIAREFKGAIHIVVWGCQTNGVPGSEMATAIAAFRPGLKILVMTGYPVGLIIFAESWTHFPRVFGAAAARGLIDAGTAESEVRVKELARSGSA
jgi:hypothetical protein